jgi:integrase/recombinase XerD
MPKNMLGQEDIEKLINACLTNRDRTLISFLYESGVRKGELLSIRIENINFDEYGAVVTIPEGKCPQRNNLCNLLVIGISISIGDLDCENQDVQ